MRRLKKGVITTALLFALLLTNESFSWAADFEVEGLNNKASESGSAAATKKKVDSASARTNLTVQLTAVDETVTIYKIASVDYDSENHVYQDAQWVDEVSNWMKAHNQYSTNDGAAIKSAYATPKALASASESTWTEFYNFLLYNRNDSEGPLNVVEYGRNKIKENEQDEHYIGELVKYAEPITVTEPENLNVTFENLELGIYAVLVTSNAGGQRFTPVVKDLTPKVNGPQGNYYIDSMYYAELKAAEATIDKKINDKQADAVRIGELVAFDINTTLPTLYPDRATLTSAGNQGYEMYIEDYLSPAFTYADEDGNEMASDDVVLSYKISSESPVEFSTEAVEYYEIADNTYSKTGESGVDYIELDDENIDDYFSCSNVTEINGYNASKAPYYAVKRSAPVYSVTIDEELKTNSADGVDCQYFRLNINVAALKQLIKAGTVPNLDSAIVNVSYKALVSDQIKVNSEGNYNTATIVYEGNAGISDTVRAYTYGVQILKVDGADDTPLGGAHFNLYKETSTFLRTASSAKNDSTFEWQKDMSGCLENPYRLTYALIKSDFENFGKDSDYYIYEMTATESGTTDLGVAYDEGDTIARVFERYETGYIDENTKFEGSIISVGNENGVTVSGLDEGNYVLMEAAAPTGYTELAEDILFTINRIDDETAQLNFNGSLSGFWDAYSDSKNLVESGVMQLKVLNYKGLILPSTGGKGILLFTILGIMIMSAAMVLIIVNQKKRTADYFM